MAAGWSADAVVHGDLYDDQVFVDDRFRLALVDLDDVGLGDPLLDAANACAHLLALAAARPAQAKRLLAYRTLVRDEFLRALDAAPADLAWREGLCVLLLATGPLRVLSPTWRRESAALTDVAVRLTAAA